MAQKAMSGEKQTGRKKATAQTRKSEGDSLLCEVCGLSVVVETVGDLSISRESALLCCGKPMKAKVTKAKTSKVKTAGR